MPRKKKTRIVKEFVNSQFKEVKKEKTQELGFEEEEQETINGGNGGNGAFSTGERAAPVIQTGNQEQNLEQVAATAPTPARTTETNTGPGNLYSADYTARYDFERYENVREQEPVQRASVRSAGSLMDNRDFDLRNLKVPQSAWTSPQEQAQAAANWQTDSNLPDERKYKPREDTFKEQTKQIDKRRRMI